MDEPIDRESPLVDRRRNREDHLMGQNQQIVLGLIAAVIFIVVFVVVVT